IGEIFILWEQGFGNAESAVDGNGQDSKGVDMNDESGIEKLAQSRWWERGIIYQIYPRSFMDSNGDGVGARRHPEQARLFGLSQSERKIVPVDVDLAAVFFLIQRLDQREQSLLSVQKFLRRPAGTQTFHRFLPRIDPKQRV